MNEKETTLQKKADGFVPTARERWKGRLEKFRERTENHIQLLEHGDKEKLLARRKAVENQILNVQAGLAEVFGELKTALEMQKAEAVRSLRRVSADYANVQSRAGTKIESVTKTRKVWDGKWYLPWTWFDSHMEDYTENHTVRYNYCLASDAMENLRQYTQESENQIEKVFSDELELNGLRRKMLTVIIHNFDPGDESYNAAFYRLTVEDTVNSIKLPVINMDISGALDGIAGKFSGEITSSEEKTELASALTHALAGVCNALVERMTTEVKQFQASLDELARNMRDSLLKNFYAEFDALQSEYGRKEEELANYKAYLSALGEEAARL